MKISVSTYSFGGLMKELGELALIELADDMGFEGIEFSELHPDKGVPKEEHARAVRAECERVGIPTVNYTIGADMLNNDLDEEVARLKKEVDIAALLGVKGMRHDAAWGFMDREWRGFDDALPILIRGCRAVTEYAAEKGIATMVENHGFFCQDSERVERLVNGVAHENFGLLVDIGNFMCADENPAVAVGRVAPYATHVHAKDFHTKRGDSPVPPDGFFRTRAGNYLRGAIIGHGEVPVAQCLRTLQFNDYDGFVSVEFEGMEAPETGIRCGFNTLRQAIGNM